MSNSPTRKNLFNFLFLQETNLANLLDQRDQLGNSREDLQKIREIEQQITDTKSQMRSKIIEDTDWDDIDLVSMYFDDYRSYRDPNSRMDFNRLNSKERLNNLERQINSDPYLRMPTLGNLNKNRMEVEDRNIENAQNTASDTSSQIDSLYTNYSNEALRASRANFLQRLQKASQGSDTYEAINALINRIDKEQEKRTNDIRDNLTRDRERPKDVDVELTFEEKQNLNLRSERQGRDIPYPDLTKPASEPASTEGQLFPNKQAAGDAVIDVHKEDASNEHSRGHDLNAGGRTEPLSLTQNHQDTYSGLFILEEVLKGFKFLLLTFVKKRFPVAGRIGIGVLNRLLPKEISDVAIRTVALMLSAPRSNKFLRGGHRHHFQPPGVATKRLVENAAIFPFLIIGLKTYFEYLGLSSGSVSFLQLAIKAVFGYVAGFQSKEKEWFTFVIDKFPKEISIEYKRHGDKIGEQDPNYEKIVTNYRMDLVKKYRKIYGTDLYKDLEKKEGSNVIGLVSMFKLLHKPTKLHELASLFKSLESSMTDLGVGGIVGLIGVAYAELTDKGELDNVELLSNLKVVGIVKYVKQTETQMPNVDTQIMLDMAKPAAQRGIGSNLQGYTIVPKMNLETVAVYKNNMDDYQIVFRGTRTDIQSFLTQDLPRNALNLAGSPELFNREPYAKNYRMASKFYQRIYNRNPRSVTIQGYSLGGIGALFLASIHNVKTNVYNPILGNNEQTIRLFKKIQEIGNNNIDIYYVPTDPISVNVPLYEGYGVRLNKVPKSKFHNAHSMKNF